MPWYHRALTDNWSLQAEADLRWDDGNADYQVPLSSPKTQALSPHAQPEAVGPELHSDHQCEEEGFLGVLCICP